MAGKKVAVFMAFGTQGDVQPVAVVAAALARAAQELSITFVTHASHEIIRRFLASHGVSFAAVSTPAVLPSAEADNCRSLSGRLEDRHREQCLNAVDAALSGLSPESASFIAINFFALEGWHIAEAYNLQCFVVAPYVVPYSLPASFARKFKNLHPLLYNRLRSASAGEVGWNDVLHWMWPLFMDRWACWREETLHLSRVPLTDPVTDLPAHKWPPASLVLYGFSTQIVECPDYWPLSIRVCGFWFPFDGAASEMGSIPPNLVSFFSRCGDLKPVYFGLSSIGSMGFLQKPEAMLRILAEAMKAVNRRCVLISAGSQPLEAAALKYAPSSSSLIDGFTLFDDRVFCCSGYVPHSKLLPKCSVAIHHGGSGTTAACLRSGVPQIICPFIHDQFYWSERMAWLGVSSQPLSSKLLVPDAEMQLDEYIDALVLRLEQAFDCGVEERAAYFAERLKLEDGAGNAVNVLLSATNLTKLAEVCHEQESE